MSLYIEKREGKRKTSYRAQVIIKEKGRIVHREGRTFSRRREADSWGSRRDNELKKALDDRETFDRLTGAAPNTLGDLITR